MIFKKKNKNKDFHFHFLRICHFYLKYSYSTPITWHFQPHFVIMSDSLTYFQYALQNFQRCKKKKIQSFYIRHNQQDVRIFSRPFTKWARWKHICYYDK